MPARPVRVKTRAAGSGTDVDVAGYRLALLTPVLEIVKLQALVRCKQPVMLAGFGSI